MKRYSAVASAALVVWLMTACNQQTTEVPTLASFPTSTTSSNSADSTEGMLPAASPTDDPSPFLTATIITEQADLVPSFTVTKESEASPIPSDTIIAPSPLPATFTPSPTTPPATVAPTEVAAIIAPTDTPTVTESPSPTDIPPSATVTESPSPSNTPTASKTLAPTEVALIDAGGGTQGSMTARVATEAINIRNGPGDEFDIIAYLDEGVIVNVLGITEDQNWLWIEYGQPGQTLQGWIYTPLTELQTASETIPITEPTPLPDFFRLEGMTWIQQQFNNCAPTAITIALTYFGGGTDQNIAREFLRPTFTRDVSVDIIQMVDYINETQQGLRSIWRMGGNWTVIRKLIASGFPVIIETSVSVNDPEPSWAGHNRVIIGYDGNEILTYDSYLGHGNFQGYRIPQNELDEVWRHMNRHFMVIYPIEREAEVAYIMGEMWQWPTSIRRSHDIALAEMRANPDNVFAQFNLGATYAELGEYEAAAAAFDSAIATGDIPFRIFWYQFSIFKTYYYTGRYNEVIYFAREALLNMGGYGAEELYYWLGMGYAGRGQMDEAKLQLQNAIAFNPHFTEAQTALDEINAGTFQPPL